MKDIINFVCLICAQDGVISSAELKRLFELLNLHSDALDLQEVNQDEFDTLVMDFFNSQDSLEDLISKIPSENLNLVLWIAKEAATADELDIRENIEFDRALKVSNLSPEETNKWDSLYS